MDRVRVDELLAKAGHCVLNNAPQHAAQALRAASLAMEPHADDDRLGRMCDLLLGISEQLSLDALQQAVRQAQPLHAKGLFDLGYLLIELGLPQIAVPFLRRLHRDLPGQAVVVEELAAALERSGLHAQARDLLLAHPSLLEHFWHRYVLCFNALSAGDLAVALAHAELLRPADAPQAHASARMRAMLQRVRQVDSDLSLSDLRGWHFVMNGSVLLHRSPHGYDEGMNGRYAYLVDSVAAIRRDLQRLVAALDAAGTQPATLRALPDPASQIVASTLGALLSVPVLAHDAAASGLIVCYDAARVPPAALDWLAREATGPQLARAACWTEPPRRIPDFVGLLHQVLVAPWDARTHYEADGSVRDQPASDEPVEVWVRRILDAADDPGEPGFDDPIASVIHLARLRASPSDRWFDGPVSSNRFA